MCFLSEHQVCNWHLVEDYITALTHLPVFPATIELWTILRPGNKLEEAMPINDIILHSNHLEKFQTKTYVATL
jgi:hypothetical protein